VISSWIGSSAVRPSDDEIRRPLILTHHSWRGKIEALWVGALPPPSFIPAGSIEITEADNAIEEEVYSAWESLPLQLLLQWRWDNDREALLLEDAAKNAAQAEQVRIAAERRAEMLRTLTLEGISERTWFENWDEELDGPNLAASRQLLANLVDSLRKAPALTKTVVRQWLRATVKDFNRLDTKNRFIETTHREDICEALEIIMAAARQPELAEEVDKWREW